MPNRLMPPTKTSAPTVSGSAEAGGSPNSEAA
jgi:hypothetical protein